MALRKFIYAESTEGVLTPQDATDELQLGKATFSGVGGIAVDAGSQRITAVANPTAATDATNQQSVDALVYSRANKAPVRAATTGDLTGWTSSGSGVGKTLTSPNNNASNNTIDAVVLVVADRVLVKNYGGGASSSHNGIYTLTQAANGAVPAILTRAIDFDSDSNVGGFDEVVAGSVVTVEDGTTNADTIWLLTTNNPITVDSTAQTWVALPTTAGSGITAPQHEVLDTLVHALAETLYEEPTYTSGQVTSVTYWTDSGKTVKVREEAYTRTNGQISQVVITQYDGAGAAVSGQTITQSVTRANGRISFVDWVES